MEYHLKFIKILKLHIKIILLYYPLQIGLNNSLVNQKRNIKLYSLFVDECKREVTFNCYHLIQ